MSDKFKLGDKVEKERGYLFPGTVVAVFKNTKGDTRVVAEMDVYGLLHIFNEEQLRKAPHEEEKDTRGA